MLIQTFKDLIVWKQGHLLVLYVYRVTKNFPRTEIFSLVDQMRRAVVSITSNIAEGFGRQGNKEKIQFLYMSLGSCYELNNQINIAYDLGYLSKEDNEKLEQKIGDVSRLLNGFIRSLKRNGPTNS
jgi:four helix bundle protein